jgi:paraquat-inducible protein A
MTSITSESQGSAVPKLRECPGCGLYQWIPPLSRNAEARCPRCSTVLRRTRSNSKNRALSLTLTSLFLYFVAVFAPFLTVDLLGKHEQSTMFSLPQAFLADGAWELAIVVMITAIIMPLVKICVMLLVLIGLRVEVPPRSLPRIFRWYERIGPWAMVEVFLLGVFVAYTRLGAIARVETGIALYAVAGLMITMVLADAVLDADSVWEKMEERGLVPPANHETMQAPLTGCDECGRVNHAAPGRSCTRCGATLRGRRPNSLNRTWALIVTAGLLYIPANIYPVLTLVQLGRGAPSTILGGAGELLASGMWPLALLVFVASVLVPVLKLVSLVFMLVETQRGSAWRLRDRTRLYRVVDIIGRWSMIDVFMLATLVGMVRDGRLASITPGLGAICFASVVILTMFGALSFDPRLMWDAAERNPAKAAVHQTNEPRTA